MVTDNQYEYDSPRDAAKVVTHHPVDATHSLPHWEAGEIKPVDKYGKTSQGFSRHRNQDSRENPKSKCNYNP